MMRRTEAVFPSVLPSSTQYQYASELMEALRFATQKRIDIK
ncbi:hypothetical protein ABKU54_22425 [Enterobacter hormaechei]